MSYEKISGTAETIAYLRSGTLIISWATAIAKAAEAEEATKRFYHRDDFDIDLVRMKKMQPWVTLRHLSLFGALKKSGLRNVIELASGLSPAGVESMTQEWNVIYRWVETDLKETIDKKRAILTHDIKVPRYALEENLFFEALDATDSARMSDIAQKHFPATPLAVVHEGLLQYLSHEEKLLVASNIRKVLEKHGGVWITTDIVLQEHLLAAFNSSQYMQRVHEILTENTRRDMAKLAFTSFDEAEELFSEAGFSVERMKQMDFPMAAAFARGPLHLQRPGRNKNLEHQQIWTMRLR